MNSVTTLQMHSFFLWLNVYALQPPATPLQEPQHSCAVCVFGNFLSTVHAIGNFAHGAHHFGIAVALALHVPSVACATACVPL